MAVALINMSERISVSSVEGGSTWRASASTPPPTYEEATTTTTTTTNKSKCYLSTFNILP